MPAVSSRTLHKNRQSLPMRRLSAAYRLGRSNIQVGKMMNYGLKRMAILAVCGTGCATAGSTASKVSTLAVCEANMIAVVPSTHWSYEDAVTRLKAEHWITDATTVVQAAKKPRVINRSVMGRTVIVSTPGTRPNFGGEAMMLAAMDVNGKIVKSHIARSSGNTDLDEFARRAIEASEYQPVVYNGCRVPAMMMVPVTLRGPVSGRR